MDIFALVHKSRFTILLGKNGAGKSTLLRKFSEQQEKNIKYVSPERGGTLKYNPNVDNNIASNDGWLFNTRQKNRSEQFREQSAVQFRNLEMLILREIETKSDKRSDSRYTFESVALEKINALLPAIKLVRSDKGFSIQSKDGAPIPEEQISSGESELIALAIEVLVFSRSEENNKLLLLDEPDVHLHPDLQQRFTQFVQAIAEERNIRVVIATHSTAVIGAFSDTADLQIVPVSQRGQTDFKEFRPSKIAQDILPVFGVHPLSSTFNKTPVMLVEGDDDKRVIEQIVRSSNGRYLWTPCPVGTVDALAEWEQWLDSVLPSLYDSPVAYSLRDLDDAEEPDLENTKVVHRIRLNCYAIENFLLTEECLTAHGSNADIFQEYLQGWALHNSQHKYAAAVKSLAKDFENRRRLNIKDVRNIVVAQLGSNKPWEVVVGQLIANHSFTKSNIAHPEHSIANYLGKQAIDKLFCKST